MSKKHKNKQEQVKHVAKETGIDPKELDRMDTTAIQQVDDLTADDDLLGGDPAAPESNEESDLGTELGSEATSEETQADGEIGVQVGDGVGGSGHIQPSGVDGETPDIPQSGLPVGEVDMNQVGPDTSETPKSPVQVEKPKGQGDVRSPKVEPHDGAVVKERVLLGTHPVTGAKVYLDEQ